MFCKKGVLKNFPKFVGKHLCWRVVACKFIKNDTPTQVFSCEFWEMFKNTFFTGNLRTNASVANGAGDKQTWISAGTSFNRNANIMKLFHVNAQKQPPRLFYKKVFLKVSQNSQQNTCQSLFFNKVAGFNLELYQKKTLWHRCFSLNFEKILKTPFLQNTSEWLLLNAFLYFSAFQYFSTCCWMMLITQFHTTGLFL